MEGAEDLERGNGRLCQLARYVRGNDRQAQHLDVEALAGIADGLQLPPAVGSAIPVPAFAG